MLRIFAARETQHAARSLRTHGLRCCKRKKTPGQISTARTKETRVAHVHIKISSSSHRQALAGQEPVEIINGEVRGERVEVGGQARDGGDDLPADGDVEAPVPEAFHVLLPGHVVRLDEEEGGEDLGAEGQWVFEVELHQREKERRRQRKRRREGCWVLGDG